MRQIRRIWWSRPLSTWSSPSGFATSPDDGTKLAWYTWRAKSASKVPLMLINGWGGVAQDWGGLVRQASKDRDVLCFDQRGVGHSQLASDYSVRLMAGDAIAVARAAGLDTHYDVAGFSLGGLVAQQFVFDEPELVRKLALCSTSPGGKDVADLVSTDFFEVFNEYADPLPEDAPLEHRNQREAARRRAAATFFVAGLPTPWVADRVKILQRMVDVFVDNSIVHRPAAGIRGQKNAVVNFNAGLERLGRVECPTLILHGDIDPVLHPQCASKLLNAIPGASILLLAGVGHHAYLQEPLEWLNAVLSFFDEH